jgi:hypothetical protein
VLRALLRASNIASCISLPVVAVVAVIRKFSSPGKDSEWLFLVSRFDHLLGNWVTMVTIAVCYVVWRRGQQSARPRTGNGAHQQGIASSSSNLVVPA